MKKVKDLNEKNTNKKSNIFIIILFIIALLFMSVGFALYNATVNINGTVVVKPDGKIYIDSVTVVNSQTSHAQANPKISADKQNVDFNLSFTTVSNEQNPVYKATFKILLKNDSSYDYIFSEPSYNPTVTNGNNDYKDHLNYELLDIENGDVIASKTQREFTVVFTFNNPEEDTGTYTVGGDFTPTLDEDTSANLLFAITGTKQGDLRGDNEFAEFTIKVSNTYNINKSFTIGINSTKFLVKDRTQTSSAQYTIDANDPGTSYTFYIQKIPGTEHTVDEERIKVQATYDGKTVDVGKISILVDRTNIVVDNDPPEISNVSAEILNDEGHAKVTWDGTDDSNVDYYTVVAYKDGTEVGRGNTTSDEEEYEFTNLSAGSYYFVVFGTDKVGNVPSDISNPSTTSGPVVKSSTDSYKWRFNVINSTDSNVSLTYINNIDYALLGHDFECTIKAKDSDYNDPTKSQITVYMNGQKLDSTGFGYTNNKLTVYNVTGDLEIEATCSKKQSTCLIKGTKILLANGEYKNIEDIRYTDLLKVYDHVTGKLTEVYPIWIEKSNVTDKYRKITFDNGTSIGIVGNHSIYDVDKKMYIDASNDNEIKVGSRVYGFDNNNLTILTVTNIEDIVDTVEYYNVVSTMYYNIIANNILTTDPTSSISNIYGFNDNAIYSDEYYNISNMEGLEYSKVDFIPHYLYKGLNLRNAKSLFENIDFLNEYLKSHTLDVNTNIIDNYFIVTTSKDKVNSLNVYRYLYKENSVYTVPNIGVEYFEETSTHKIYKPGDKIKVEYSIYLREVKNN